MNVTISNFSSLFEVSIAIHILYSLIPQIQRAYLARALLVYKHLQRAIKSLESRQETSLRYQKQEQESDAQNNVDALWDSLGEEKRNEIRERRKTRNNEIRGFDRLFLNLRWHESGFESSMLALENIAHTKSRLFIPLSVVVAVISIGLLILSGFCPELEVHWIIGVLILLLAITPMPIMLYLTYRSSLNEIKRVYESVGGIQAAIQLHSEGRIDELKP